MKYTLLALLFTLSLLTKAQSQMDVLHYRFEIALNDLNDSIVGTAYIKLKTPKSDSLLAFDLSSINAETGKGMLVTSVAHSGNPSNILFPTIHPYSHSSSKLIIRGWKDRNSSDTLNIMIRYRGIPADGLIISKSKFGRRTFFSDNWPDRARQWIPTNDIPGDKASVEFIVTAPSHYKVVSNGVLSGETSLGNGSTVTHWKEEKPLPTKIMVIGVADFSIDTSGIVDGIPVTSWVFPENAKEGFRDYAPAKDILKFFIDYIGPYPYKKLANVQSKTTFGGMENASAIFYYENSVTGEQQEEGLIAHEVAHQWFGDMVTEKNYSHLWLSEGFATQLKHYYLEKRHGFKRARIDLEEDRDQVIAFVATSNRTVVDSISTFKQLLNANSYQKGGWILHMLRRKVGDDVYRNIIREFYAAYASKNADTRDFQAIAEKVYGRKLDVFFQQWLYSPGIPKLDLRWKYDGSKKEFVLVVTQLQSNPFEFPLELSLSVGNGKKITKRLDISRARQEFRIPISSTVHRVIADPNTSLLFQGNVSKLP
ncbi:MAG: M1 family peptidase [Chitinophagaceae bacterium]|nr:M1 family peptidase [Chitinophagaceae bacterium]